MAFPDFDDCAPVEQNDSIRHGRVDCSSGARFSKSDKAIECSDLDIDFFRLFKEDTLARKGAEGRAC